MLRTFRKGGIHPPESKLSRNEQIKLLPLPQVADTDSTAHRDTSQSCSEAWRPSKGGYPNSRGGELCFGQHTLQQMGTVAKLDEVVDASGLLVL